jgi:hypothetical protein
VRGFALWVWFLRLISNRNQFIAIRETFRACFSHFNAKPSVKNPLSLAPDRMESAALCGALLYFRPPTHSPSAKPEVGKAPL